MVSTKVITNPISNIPVNQKSHVFGWAQLWQQQLKAAIDHKCTPDIMRYDEVYIDHGVNFGGTLNLFGGATKEVFDRINRVASCKNIISLDHDMPDYGAMLKKRISAPTTYEGITEEWCDNLSARLSNVPSFKQEDHEYDSLTLGDSHSIAFSGPGHRVLRNDAKTLHGALKTGLKNMLRGAKPTRQVFLCFGSIDIRHHILRHDDFSLKDFIAEYVKQGNEIQDEFGVHVSYCAPVPVEFEGRRIPKSGFYKKTPFFGSMEERRVLTSNFIEELYNNVDEVIHPPFEWYTMDGEKYANTYMEHGSSFHIAPPFYNRNDWGVSPLVA
jgi:hypothetical protein